MDGAEPADSLPGRGACGSGALLANGLADELPGWRSMVPVYLVMLAMPVDDAMVLPSLWGFVHQLGGDASDYGWVQAAYYAGRLVGMPVCGSVADRTKYARVFAWALGLGVLASLLYTAAPIMGGVPMLALSRALLGLSSAVSVAAIAYIAEHVPPAHRIKAFSITFGLQRAVAPMAPLLNLICVRLPPTTVGSLEMTSYNYAGVISAAFNGLILLSLSILREPPRSPTRLAAPAPRPAEVCSTLRRTGAYVSYVLSFQNNWTNQTVVWTLPIVTEKLYPYLGIVGNAFLLAGGGVTGMATALLTPRFFRGVEDRWQILFSQAILGATLLPYMLAFGCNCCGGPPLWLFAAAYWLYNVPFLLQMPANNSIYTRLVGQSSQGVWISLLEMSKTLARIIAGYMIGKAYGALGPCLLWGLTFGIWAFQFLPLLLKWRSLSLSNGSQA